jgi:hypothetical protein
VNLRRPIREFFTGLKRGPIVQGVTPESREHPSTPDRISEEEFRSWLASGKTIEQGIAGKLALRETQRNNEETQRYNESLALARRIEERAVQLTALFWGIAASVAIAVVMGLWVYYAENRTSTVQAVRQNTLYMNDATVWDIGDSFGLRVIEGDKIRYVYPLPSAPGDHWLSDTTRGTSALGVRLSSPSPNTSCPRELGFPFSASRKPQATPLAHSRAHFGLDASSAHDQEGSTTTCCWFTFVGSSFGVASFPSQ